MGDCHGIVTSMYTEQILFCPQRITLYVSAMQLELLPCSLSPPESSHRLGESRSNAPRACSTLQAMLLRTIGTHVLPSSLCLSRSSQACISQHRKNRLASLTRGTSRTHAAPHPPQPNNQALSIFLPLVFLLCSILRPVLVRIRLRNPCLRMRISREGRFMFMYRRGPQRICEPAPASAGCDVIAVLGTTSAVAVPPTASAAAAAVVVAAAGVKALGMRSPAAGLRAKMLGGADRPGRRVGREEKDLGRCAVRQSEIPRWVWAGGCRANLVMVGCRATSRTAARSADWAKSRDIVTVLQWVGRPESC